MAATTEFKKAPAVNQATKGALACNNILVNRNNSVWWLIGSGTPVDGTSGTGAGFAGPGSLYTDIATPKIFINGGAGTKASPVWKIVTSA